MQREITKSYRLILIGVVVAATSCSESNPKSASVDETSGGQVTVNERKLRADDAAASGGTVAPVMEGRPIGLTVTDIDGAPYDLKQHRGKPVLIVNTASECGYTPQYATLEKLHRAYRDRGFVLLGAPSNDFGAQEPGTNAEIKAFTRENYDVTFQLLDKQHATGAEISPLFASLTAEGPESTRGAVAWNFTKFLLDGEGRIVGRFESKVDPMSPEITGAIDRLLVAAAAPAAAEDQ